MGIGSKFILKLPISQVEIDEYKKKPPVLPILIPTEGNLRTEDESDIACI